MTRFGEIKVYSGGQAASCGLCHTPENEYISFLFTFAFFHPRGQYYSLLLLSCLNLCPLSIIAYI